jgi:hypothetical protein
VNNAPPPGQSLFFFFSFCFVTSQLHCSANEQWRVNYNSFSTVLVACEQWRAIVHGWKVLASKKFQKIPFEKL